MTLRLLKRLLAMRTPKPTVAGFTITSTGGMDDYTRVPALVKDAYATTVSPETCSFDQEGHITGVTHRSVCDTDNRDAAADDDDDDDDDDGGERGVAAEGTDDDNDDDDDDDDDPTQPIGKLCPLVHKSDSSNGAWQSQITDYITRCKSQSKRMSVLMFIDKHLLSVPDDIRTFLMDLRLTNTFLCADYDIANHSDKFPQNTRRKLTKVAFIILPQIELTTTIVDRVDTAMEFRSITATIYVTKQDSLIGHNMSTETMKYDFRTRVKSIGTQTVEMSPVPLKRPRTEEDHSLGIPAKRRDGHDDFLSNELPDTSHTEHDSGPSQHDHPYQRQQHQADNTETQWHRVDDSNSLDCNSSCVTNSPWCNNDMNRIEFNLIDAETDQLLDELIKEHQHPNMQCHQQQANVTDTQQHRTDDSNSLEFNSSSLSNSPWCDNDINTMAFDLTDADRDQIMDQLMNQNEFAITDPTIVNYDIFDQTEVATGPINSAESGGVLIDDTC